MVILRAGRDDSIPESARDVSISDVAIYALFGQNGGEMAPAFRPVWGNSRKRLEKELIVSRETVMINGQGIRCRNENDKGVRSRNRVQKEVRTCLFFGLRS